MKDPHKGTIFQLATNNLSLYNVEKAIENSTRGSKQHHLFIDRLEVKAKQFAQITINYGIHQGYAFSPLPST